jgi:hypothetical protein
MAGPFSDARVEGSDIIIPCAGIGQAVHCLPIAQSANVLLTALADLVSWVEPDRIPPIFMEKARAALKQAREESA